jgi:RNA polymerase sigma-70 factor (ECF subfamily)
MNDAVSAPSLAMLLERLHQGDLAAAEQVFLLYEPSLRLLVRRQLSARVRAKFDSIDVVQSVWADLLDRFRLADQRFTDVDHLQAFLIKSTRNRFVDRLRQHRAALSVERPLDGAVNQADREQRRPSEFVIADELWHEMVAVCPPAHRDLLLWKRQGYTLAELAQRTGLHPSSIRRIFYDLARRLALKRQGYSSPRHVNPRLKEIQAPGALEAQAQ